MKKVRLALLGAGNRGMEAYGAYAREHPYEVEFTAVAEPDERRRRIFAEGHDIPVQRRYEHWEELLAAPQEADAVLVCTQDRMHREPAIRALQQGYHVLLEKPMAPDPAGCLAIAEAGEQSGRILAVCHELRYAPFFVALKSLVADGLIGELVSIQHNENVGYQHFAHSYVRGNWRRSDSSTPLIVAKSCHDMDILAWLTGAACRKLSSFGSLTHFRPENAPAGSTERCTDGCTELHRCPFAAPSIYSGDPASWPASVVTSEGTREALLEALDGGPYGRCVYRCDNDVPDHQVVSLEFENGVTAAFTLSAFTAEISRSIKLMGTHGELRGHLERNEIELHRFSDGTIHRIAPGKFPGRHGGGDAALMERFVAALSGRSDPGTLTPPMESARNHLIAFAAERSRLDGCVIELDRYTASLER